jgi:uncharacterized protein (DUF488 family)
MNLYTIGFTHKTARQFFDLLQQNGVQRIIDIRLYPGGQLAGFTKQADLPYFLRELIDCDYRHLSELAPTDELLKSFRSDKNWQKYEPAFFALMQQRGIPEKLDRSLFEEKTCCLLCSEATPEHCHRRLVAELLASKWEGVTVIHI